MFREQILLRISYPSHVVHNKDPHELVDAAREVLRSVSASKETLRAFHAPLTSEALQIDASTDARSIMHCYYDRVAHFVAEVSGVARSELLMKPKEVLRVLLVMSFDEKRRKLPTGDKKVYTCWMILRFAVGLALPSTLPGIELTTDPFAGCPIALRFNPEAIPVNTLIMYLNRALCWGFVEPRYQKGTEYVSELTPWS